MADARLTKAAFAEVMGVDRAQPTRWAQKGMPVHEDGTVEPVAAATWVRKNVADYARKERSRGAIEQRQAQSEHLVQNYDAGVRAAVYGTAHQMLDIAAQAAVTIGLTMEQTFALVRDMQTHGGHRRDRILEWMQVPQGERRPGEPLSPKFVSWEALAAYLDVPVDLVAWSAYADRIVGPDPRPDLRDVEESEEEEQDAGAGGTSLLDHTGKKESAKSPRCRSSQLKTPGKVCRVRGSNPRPSVYKTAALPLC